MPQIAQRLIGKAGMALGIVVIVGSIMAGVVLAADLWRVDDQADTGVPAGNEGSMTPTDTGSPGASPSPVSPSAVPPALPTPTPPAGGEASTSAPAGGSTTTRPPNPTPTCWLGTGERPDGIEKCEDN